MQRMEQNGSATRRRKLHRAEGQTQEGPMDAAFGGAVKDPLVRTSAKPPSETNVDEKWDLEDDEDWVDGQTPGKEQTAEDAELARRRRVLKRDAFEVGVAFAFHLAAMCVYIYIHVYDATLVKKNKGKGFEGLSTYGGRWKYLTYINLWMQFAYFFMCFFTDIMPWSSAKYWFLQACDVFFTTVSFPLSLFVMLMFWGIYFIDREMVYPQELDKYIPSYLNHCWHTVPAIFIVLEAIIVFHRYPSKMLSAVFVFVISTTYIVWIVLVFTKANIWPYPFFRIIPLPALPVFFTVNFIIALLLHFVGRLCCYLRWKDRHDLMDEMGL